MTAADADLLRSALSGSYTFERELGRGGMATVYLARDVKHDRQVALKVLHPDLAATLGPERFQREIRFAARLQHPHILTVLDSGEAGGRLWFTMPYVEGESLRDRLRRERQLPLDEALRIAREAAQALHYAHRHDVLHRDIKPENILLTHDGNTLVADFGVARALAGEEALTQTGLAVGTPAYMSPEQAAGERGLDARSDIYALGCVLYEMIAGEPPFTGPTPQAIIAKRFSTAPTPVAVTRPEVPAEVDRLVLRSLARVPADRFASADEFAQALRLGITTPTVTRVPQASIARRRRRWLVPATLTAVLAGGLGAAWLRTRQAPTAADASAFAVLPFRVAGPGLELWREGLVDLLAINLDGAGGLRAIPPRTVLSQWHRDVGEGDVDQTRALDVARAVGARYALTGSIVGGGASLRLTAELVDLTAAGARARAQTEGSADSVPAMVDRLTLNLVRAGLPGRTAGQGGSDLGGVTTRSITALKHYLAGEQLFRGGQADSAVAEYRAAADADSTFALAAYRLVVASSWPFSPHSVSDFPDDLVARLLPLAGQLPPKEAMVTRTIPLLRHGVIDALPALQQIVTRFPYDAEAWFQYGDALFHLGGAAGHPREVFRQALRRATDLDPGLGFAYVHLAEDAFDRGDSAEVLRILAALRRTDARSPKTTGLALAYAQVWGASADRVMVRAALDTASSAAIITAKHALDLTPDLLEPTLVFAKALTAPRHDAWMRGSGYGGMAYIYRAVGRMAESRREILKAFALWGGTPDQVGELDATLTIFDYFQGVADSARAERAYAHLSAGPDSLTDPEVLGRFAAVTHRPAHVERWLRVIGGQISRAEARKDSLFLRRLRADQRVVRAYAAEARGERDAVLRALRASVDVYPQTYENNGAQLRLDLARRLIAAGDFAGAERYLGTFDIGSYNISILLGQVELYRGQAAEGLGRRDEAKTRYANVVRWWRQCDPELVPLREQAREALTRLTAEPQDRT